MSTTTPEAPNITDDSRVVADEGKFAELKSALLDSARKVVSKAVAATNAYKNHAQLEMAVAATIFRPTGFPDWARSTDTYKRLVEDACDAVFGKLDSDTRNRVKGSIRQHVNRTYRERAIVEWIRANHPVLKERVDGKEDGEFVVPDDDEQFKAAVREHYLSQVNEKGEALLTVPPKYATKPPTGSGTGGGPDGTPSALVPLDTALSGLASVTGDFATLGILKGISAVAESLTKKDARYGEHGVDFVRQTLRRIGTVAVLTSKQLDEKELTEDEVKNLKTAKFSAKDEKLAEAK